MRISILLLTAVALSVAPGCSYMTVVGPPAPQSASAMYGPPASYDVTFAPATACTTSKLAPIVDTVLASLYIPSGIGTVAMGAYFIDEANGRRDQWSAAGSFFVGVGLIEILVATTFALSARSGYRNVTACRAAHARRGY